MIRPKRYLTVLAFVAMIHPAPADEKPGRPWEASPEMVAKFSSQPGEFNYDEKKVPEYELPDPLISPEGNHVTTAQQWNASQRSEILNRFRDYVYGHRPETEYKMSFEETGSVQDAFGGIATGRQIMAKVSIGARSFQFPFTWFTPNKVSKPVPAVVVINNRQFISLEQAAAPVDAEAAEFWPVQRIIERGYATATFFTSNVDPDRADGYAEGLRAFFVENKEPEYSDWRCLSAWGWAASRIHDYLLTRKEIDPAKIMVAGHSRGGKTALWAAAEDSRFAVAFSNNSGCGGAALSRRAYGETVARITANFPHWFCPGFAEYANREDDIPVDQHELIALIAPRAVYVTSADEDLWADPRGEYLSVVHARPVFQLLGLESISGEEMPPLNQPRITGKTGYHIRSGKHDLTRRDWEWFLDFADRQK